MKYIPTIFIVIVLLDIVAVRSWSEDPPRIDDPMRRSLPGPRKSNPDKSDERKQDILRRLKDPDSMVRVGAFEDFSDYFNDKTAIPALNDLLKDTDATIRRAAIQELICLNSRESLPNISNLINDKSPYVRSAVLVAFRTFAARDKVKAILPLLEDEDRNVRTDAIQTLVELDARESLAKISALFDDKAVRPSVISAWAAFQERDKIKVLLPLLKRKNSEDHNDRWAAINALGELGATEAVDQLTDILRNEAEHEYLREGTILALARINARKAIPHIIPLLDHRSPSIRRSVATAIIYFGAKGEAMDQVLAMLKKDAHPHIRMTGLLLAKELDVQEAIPSILDLQDVNAPDYYVIDTLGSLKATAAAPKLRKILERNDDNDVFLYSHKGSAIRALGEMRDTESAALILRCFLSASDGGRAAGSALKNMGITDATPKLIALLKENSTESNRSGIIDAIGEIGAKEAIPEIQKYLSDDDFIVGSSAVEALGKMGAKEECVDHLLKMLNDERFVYACIGALGTLGAREAIPALRKMLGHPNFAFRSRALESLVRLGAKEAIADVVDLQQHWETCGWAVIALVEWGAKDLVTRRGKQDALFLCGRTGESGGRAVSVLKKLGYTDDRIKLSGIMSRTEAIAQYAQQHPDHPEDRNRPEPFPGD